MARVRVDELADSWRALVLGCSVFRHPGIARLLSPDSEARAIAAALTDSMGIGLAPSHVTVLTNADATRGTVIDALETMTREQVTGQRLLLYFSGHGIRFDDDFGLVLHDGDPDVPSSLLLGRDIARLLADANLSGVLIVLDCCASGDFAEHAPEFFRRLDRANFRILLSSSRADQRAWESVDGKGTVFSRHFRAVLCGRSAAGDRPGEITFAGLLDAIDVGMQEEPVAEPADQTVQEPVFAGVYPRDPLLFVHRASLVSGLTIETSRVSRSYLRRVLAQVLIAVAAAVVFAAGTHIAWLEKHEYADTLGGRIVIFRGFPGLNAWGYPTLQAELEYDPRDMREESPLRSGRPLPAPLDTQVEPLVWGELSDHIRGAHFVSEGQPEKARTLLLPLIRTIVSGKAASESGVAASLFLPDMVRPEDMSLAEQLLAADRIETRTAAVRALSKLDVGRALKALTTDAPDRRVFDHAPVLATLESPCSGALSAYFSRMLEAKDAHNIVLRVLDTSLRLRCALTDESLSRVMDVSSYDDIRYVGLVVQFFQRQGIRMQLPAISRKDSSSRRMRIAIASMEAGLPACLRSSLGPNATDDLSDRLRYAELAVRTCGSRVLDMNATASMGMLRLVTKNGIAEGMAWQWTDMSYFDVRQLVDVAKASRPLDTHAFFRHVLNIDSVDSTAKAVVVDHLRRSGGVYADESIGGGNSINLRRAVALWKARQSPAIVAADLFERMNDGDQFDFPEIASYLTFSRDQLREARDRAARRSEEGRRATALVALHGTTEDIELLMRQRRRDIDSSVMDYIGYRMDLSDLMSRFRVAMPSHARAIEERLRQKERLAGEMSTVEPASQSTRVALLLKARHMGTNVRDYLSPGLVLWLRQAYGVEGDVGLN